MFDAKILLVEDDAALSEALVDTLSLSQYECVGVDCAEAAIIALKSSQFDMVISDIQMPGIGGIGLLNHLKEYYPKIPLLLMTAFATVDNAVNAIKQGAVDYLAKPFSPQVLLDQVSRYLPIKTNINQPIAVDEKSIALFALADRVAASNASVMITGPSGSGKEVLAHYIHQQSQRNNKPFVAINCAAIPENMLEATLFGYEKGAFTGAYQACPGKFEQAQGGTLLLDEISEMDLGIQAKLLRVLQEKEVERLGGRKTIKLNVRVLATSNRDLKVSIKKGAFREDLYYRINVFPLAWTPLNQRQQDILPLALYLLQRHATSANLVETPKLDGNAKKILLAHVWPGNVRELDNVMHRAMILCQGNEIKAQDVIIDKQDSDDKDITNTVESLEPSSSSILSDAHSLNDVQVSSDGLGKELQLQEHEIILEALHQFEGNRKQVANKLGISARTLRYKMARMRDSGINIPS